MNVLVSGSSGLIGSKLIPLLVAQGHQVRRLLRSKNGAKEEDIVWGDGGASLDPKSLAGIEAVVHLAGESIASGRWNEAKKQAIRDSRLNSTRILSETFTKLDLPPKVFVCASAIGYYGDRGEEDLDENSGPGKGFLSSLCQDWEKMTVAAQELGVRVVNLRLGVVLSAHGGALAQMLPPFLMGAGGNFGSGKQYMSWIAIDDVIHAIDYCLKNEQISGPVNLTAPGAVTNAQFTKALGKVLMRPTLIPVPEFGARLMFGEMADELLLSSLKVRPYKLRNAGYHFLYPSIEAALRRVLGKQ